MSIKFFESLSQDEAWEFLNGFLDSERKGVQEMIKAAQDDGVTADFTVQSVAPLLNWASKKHRTFPRAADETVPSWIRETESYTGGLFDFDEPSKILILRSAYYMGESFVNYSEGLRWSIGEPETAHKNMPVVTGFTFKLELAPIWVVENLSRRIVRLERPNNTFEQAVSYWLDKVPK